MISSGGNSAKTHAYPGCAGYVAAIEGDGHVKLAGPALNFMHHATLLTDDVVDESDMRRGQEISPHVWGQSGQACLLVIICWPIIRFA